MLTVTSMNRLWSGVSGLSMYIRPGTPILFMPAPTWPISRRKDIPELHLE